MKQRDRLIVLDPQNLDTDLLTVRAIPSVRITKVYDDVKKISNIFSLILEEFSCPMGSA